MDPWGDTRADLRSAAHLAAWAAITSGAEEADLPLVTWPYFREAEEAFNETAAMAAFEAHLVAYGYREEHDD